jgi:hypothetical protein
MIYHRGYWLHTTKVKQRTSGSTTMRRYSNLFIADQFGYEQAWK